MKKINKIGIYSALILATSFSACKKDFLEVTPTTAINSAEAFSSPEKIAAALTGVYDLSTNGSYKYNMILNSDVKGGDVLVVSGAGNYNRFINGYQFIENPSSVEPSDYWTIGYRIIANANQFELNIPTSSLADAQKSAYLAETRALRAEAYFWLVQWYAKPYTLDPEALGVPLVLAPLGPNDALTGRAKVKEVYAQILSDFLYAEANIPASKTSVYRMTKGAIQGFLARVYLTMGDYPNASKYAKLARVGKPLAAGSTLLSGFINPSSEWIYALNSRTDDNAGFITVNSFYDPFDIGYSSFRAADNFFNSFAANDIRLQQFKVNGVIGARRGQEGFLINKFDFNTTPAQNQVIIRSSEMYLIEAEAEARQGVANEAAAKTALLAIQQRAGVATAVSANTGQALINEIMTERGKELYGEGFKFLDLLRTKTPIVRTAGNGHWALVNFQPGDNKLALPLPQSELNANPVLKGQQNPGYSN
ncbi:RagB/SusD family nutrient uptake outer membrane protein [Pedobacter sp.]|uniref:RagB/SusD family nutrient uptake outer membrane protein n=1 Tax=Pedobacter sp. TaxID=1411316 RepID=UPI003BAB7534